MSVKSVLTKFDGFDVELNFKKRMKNMRLKVAKTGKISMSLPFYSTQKAAFNFLRLHRDWLAQTHAKIIAALPQEDEIILLGKRYKLVIDESLKSVRVREFEAEFDGERNLNGSLPQFDDLSGAVKSEFDLQDSKSQAKFNDPACDFFSGKSILNIDAAGTKFNNQNGYGADKKSGVCADRTDKFSGFSDVSGDVGRGGSKTHANLESKFSEIKHRNLAQNLDADGFAGLIYTPNLAKLDKFKKALASKIYAELIAKFSPHINKPVNRVIIRKMTTRWGSCNSRKGYINLSLNLLAKPLPLIEYVVLHELTHLIYPHHKASFYEFIARIMPDFRSLERELNGKNL